MSSDLPSIGDLLKKIQTEKQEQQKIADTLQAEANPADATTSTAAPSQAPILATTPTAAHDGSAASLLAEKMQEIQKKQMEEEAGKTAAALGIPSINLKGFPISPEAISLIPEDRAKELKAVSFVFTGPEIRIGAVNPENTAVKELVYELGERHKANTKLYIISEESYLQAMKLYAAIPKIKNIIKGVQITEDELARYQAQMADFTSIAAVLQKATVTDVLTVILAAALKLGSSDIHIEAEEKGIAVRVRADGILTDVSKLDRELWKRIINRIKLIASLKMNVTNQAQDGRFTIFQKNKQIDVRISTIPTSFGESVVMRILNPDTISLEFDSLGFRAPVLKKIMKEIERPNGMIITTGPTGSGKTTTLYAILKRLNTSDVKIITLEDPVEYKVEGLNQSQIDHSRDYTFAKGLRSILRQDPDIVMVGEIRDQETAEIAVQAALTGHLLLSTIHTNDAAGAIPRFLSMGVPAHLLAPAINAIMGQRLIRKLCQVCKKEAPLEPDLLADVKKTLADIPEASGEPKIDLEKLVFYAPAGCDKCNNTGYKGRVGVYEVLTKGQEVEKAILGGSVSEYEMRTIAKTQGMITMAQDGLLKCLDGLTSVDEVKRIVGL